mmetsp:Transcript_18999/g.27837  ORF Transcript_18999/g.27837 Transcript_18999/m.27837 type:complete len:215 (-) Transcript_18999:4244-4888(-)
MPSSTGSTGSLNTQPYGSFSNLVIIGRHFWAIRRGVRCMLSWSDSRCCSISSVFIEDISDVGASLIPGFFSSFLEATCGDDFPALAVPSFLTSASLSFPCFLSLLREGTWEGGGSFFTFTFFGSSVLVASKAFKEVPGEVFAFSVFGAEGKTLVFLLEVASEVAPPSPGVDFSSTFFAREFLLDCFPFVEMAVSDALAVVGRVDECEVKESVIP